MKCDSPHRTPTGELNCPHCNRPIERECLPNVEECPVCEDAMEWDAKLKRYMCQNCGELGPLNHTPTECGECGRVWPWEEPLDRETPDAKIPE